MRQLIKPVGLVAAVLLIIGGFVTAESMLTSRAKAKQESSWEVDLRKCGLDPKHLEQAADDIHRGGYWFKVVQTPGVPKVAYVSYDRDTGLGTTYCQYPAFLG